MLMLCGSAAAASPSPGPPPPAPAPPAPPPATEGASPQAAPPTYGPLPPYGYAPPPGYPPAGGYYVPCSAPPRPPSPPPADAHNHAGFFLRMGVNRGYLSSSSRVANDVTSTARGARPRESQRGLDAAAVSQYAAVRLFIARATAVRPDFRSPTRTRPPWRRSPPACTACPSRSSWPRRGSSSSRPRPCAPRLEDQLGRPVRRRPRPARAPADPPRGDRLEL